MLAFFVVATILLHPTYNACSVEADTEYDELSVEYRTEKGKWTTCRDFKGSLMNLSEDTVYEVRLKDGGKIVESGSFRTWKTNVPIGKTIELDPSTLSCPYVISERGSGEGWIRYVIRGGEFTNPTEEPTFIIEDASNVILEGMTLRGTVESKNVIIIRNSSDVRILNCDISGWGRTGKPDFSYVTGYGPGNGRLIWRDGKVINANAAVKIARGSSNITIERCYIHDAYTHTCSWYYCHPAGSEAVWMERPDHSTVIRWCDFVGSDTRRFNDCIEGDGNFESDGGFNSNADIYGNFMCFANDDCMEADGGQKNIRIFDNRFESALCGVSVQGCMVGPSLIYNNLFSGVGEEFNKYGQNIKTAGKNGQGAKCYVWKNTFWGKNNTMYIRPTLTMYIKENVFCGPTQRMHEMKYLTEDSEVEDNAMNYDLAEKELNPNYPVRDLPFSFNRARITVGKDLRPLVVKIKGRVPEGSKVLHSVYDKWIKAELVDEGLRISFVESEMKNRRNYRTAVLVRTPEGLSRAVTIYAETDYEQPYRHSCEGITAIYDDGFTIKSNRQPATAEFDIEKSGRYWVLVYGSAIAPSSVSDNEIRVSRLNVTLDGGEQMLAKQQFYGYKTWSMLIPHEKTYNKMVYVQHFDLKVGKHRFDISSADGDASISGIVLTDSPQAFVPDGSDY